MHNHEQSEEAEKKRKGISVSQQIGFSYLYLKGRITERGGEAESSSKHRFTPQIASVASAQLVYSQEPGVSLGSPLRLKLFGHPLLLSRAIPRELDQRQSSHNMLCHMLCHSIKPKAILFLILPSSLLPTLSSCIPSTPPSMFS